MSDEIDLVREVVGSGCDAQEAADILDAARQDRVDPLEYLAHVLGAEPVYSAAAAWAGAEFAAAIPDAACTPRDIDRVDHIGAARTFRTRVDGADIVYCAPPASGIVALRDHFVREPDAQRRFRVVCPQALRRAYARAAETSLLDAARWRLARVWPGASAMVVLGKPVRTLFVVLLCVLLGVVAIAPFFGQPLITPLVGILLIVPAVLKLLAVMLRQPEEGAEPPLLADADLPPYSVLIPLRDEAQMVLQLGRAMAALDYPATKLQVLFIVESKSAKTVAAVEKILGDARFELLVVPDSLPRTKPKALNYGLPFVRGEHVVVFDAEDVPDPDQLRKAASVFAADRSIDCLQAELVIDNAGETPLTALFAGEYAGQFGFMLPLLSRWRLPIPLGGTSNHFRTRSLRQIGGWDAHNVTEDADLGVRLARMRYRSATLRSCTREEAPLGLRVWMGQRTRWMKGWMQTFVVHNRRPFELLSDLGWVAFIGFQVYVFSMIVSALLHTVFLASFVTSLALGSLMFPDTVWGWANFAILIVGYSGAFAIVIAGLQRQRVPLGVVLVQLLLPLYWVLHTIAAARAAYDLFARPYYWAKTAHGRTKLARPIADPRGPVSYTDRIEPSFFDGAPAGSEAIGIAIDPGVPAGYR